MDISEIIKDSVKYPISDLKKFLILGLPNLVLTIFYVVLVVQAIGLDEITHLPDEAYISSPLFTTFIITTLLFFVVLIIGGIIIEGIQLSVIRETINYNDILPTINLKNNFIDGIKSIIPVIIYMIIPISIYMLLLFAVIYVSQDFAIIAMIILSIIFVFILFILSAMYCTALCKLAETNSLSEALSIKNIYELAKNIGLGRIIGVMIICNVINYIISLVGTFILEIPLIGLFIVTYILYNYYFLLTSRSYGLLYRDYFGGNNNFGQNIKQEQITGRNIPQEIDYPHNENTVNVNDNLDFNPKTSENNEKNISNLKRCSQCGYPNPEYVNYCSNCGNEL